MNGIWVAHDRNKDNTWKQSKPELLSMVSNLLFVRKYHPEILRNLFVDDWTKKYLSQFGILSLFHNINTTVLNKSYKINPEVFWAYSKILAQRATKGPTITFDLDFRLFQNLNSLNFFDYDVSAFSLEDTTDKYYYSSPEHCLGDIVIDKKFDFDKFAVTVCCLFIKDNDFKNQYCDWALDYMYQWTYNHRNDDKYYGETYILFAEQYMLAQRIKRENKRLGLIIDDFQLCPLPSYAQGMGPSYNSFHNYVYHYGMEKKELSVGSDRYNEELKLILGHANENLQDKLGLEILNRIANIDDNEGCFRKLDQTLR